MFILCMQPKSGATVCIIHFNCRIYILSLSHIFPCHPFQPFNFLYFHVSNHSTKTLILTFAATLPWKDRVARSISSMEANREEARREQQIIGERLRVMMVMIMLVMTMAMIMLVMTTDST